MSTERVLRILGIRNLWGIAIVIGIVAFASSFVYSLVSPSAAQAAVPTTMNFQGRLTNSSNVPVSDGLYNMKFRIYTVSSGGTDVWSETRETTNRVQVTGGLFSVQLGSVTPLSASVFNSSALYFEMELPTPATATCSTAACASFTEGAMTPRSLLATSAYAFNSETLDGLDSAQFARNDAANIFSGTQTVRADSASALSVQNAAGSTTYLNVDTSTGAITANANINVSAGKTFLAQGDATVKATSTSAFQVQNAGGTALLSVDTSGSSVTVGSATNGVIMTASGISFVGTARPTSSVTLAPEYAGATFIGDGTSNTGTLTSDFCSGASRMNINATACGATDTRNYYQWANTQATVQDYDIYVRYQIPSDYDTGTMTNLKILGWGTTTTNETVTVALYSDSTGTACSTSGNAVTANATWSSATVASPLGTCTIVAGDTVTFKVRVAAGQNNSARASAISFSYRQKF